MLKQKYEGDRIVLYECPLCDYKCLPIPATRMEPWVKEVLEHIANHLKEHLEESY